MSSRRRLGPGRAAWTLAALGAWGACEGSHKAPLSPADAGPAVADAAADLPDAIGTRPPRTGAALPPGVAPARRILDSGATLTGGGEGSCSHQVPASGNGDRWCLFTRPGADTRTELWAIDVTHAAAASTTCDGTDPGCVRLSANVWMGGGLNGPFQPYANRFFGDTVVFYADALSGPMDVHRGPAFAWRPGWAQARRISSDSALECWGHAHALVAHCVEDLVGDPVRPDAFDLHAGPIADRDGIVLPSVGRVVPRGPDGQLAWQAGFSPAGDQFAVSQPDAATGKESLRVVATDRAGQAPALTIAPDAHHWQIGSDGKRVFFLRAPRAGEESLLVADFPAGTNPVLLDPKINDFFLLGLAGQDRGVGYVSDLGPDRGAFRIAADPSKPATAGSTATTVFSYESGLDALRLSRDLRFTAWRNPDFRVNVVQHDNLKSCLLNNDPTHPAYSISFLDHAGLVFWAESDGGDRDRRDGFFADPTGCEGKRPFAQSLYFLMPIGDRGLIFADEVDDTTQRANLKYAAITAGNEWPGNGPVRVHDDIDGTSVLFVGSDPLLLLFTVSTGSADQQGTYLFGPVPF